jgi:hypothetical protein
LEQRCGSGGGKKESYSGCIPKVKSTKFTDRLDVECDRKKGTKDGTCFFFFSPCALQRVKKEWSLIIEMGKIVEEYVWRGGALGIWFGAW